MSGEGYPTSLSSLESWMLKKLKKVLETGLLPLVNEVFPDGHPLYQDNDPKHTSGNVVQFLRIMILNGGPLHRYKPNWGSMKQYPWNTFKPRTLDELNEGIQEFWQTLSPEVCQRYISHLDISNPQDNTSQWGTKWVLK